MGNSRPHRREAVYTGLFVLTLLVNGCAGMEPYEPPDHREEGPKQGLFSGEEGEFVIFRRENTERD
jgi:hypothetical protein